MKKGELFKEGLETYRFLGECKVEDLQTGEWYDAVMYQDAELGGTIYIKKNL